MKKLGRLGILAGVLVLIIVAYMLVNSYLKKQEEKENSEPVEDLTVNVLSLDKESIVKIDYVIEGDAVSLIRKDDVWSWSEDPEFPLVSGYATSMASSLANLTALRLIADDLEHEEDYGLKEPQMEIKFSTSDGKEYVYSIGNFNTVTNGYYFKVSTVDKVYIDAQSSLSSFAYSILDMAEPQPTLTIGGDNITSVEYSCKGKKYTLTDDGTGMDLTENLFSYFFIDGDGVKSGADESAAKSLTKACEDIYYGGAAAYKPENLAEYGLDADNAVYLTVNYNEVVSADDTGTSVTVKSPKTYVVTAGRSVSSDGTVSYYLLPENCDLVYNYPAGEELFDAIEGEMASRLICPVSSDELVSMEIKIGEDTWSIKSSDLMTSSKSSNIHKEISSLEYSGKTSGPVGKTLMTVTVSTVSGSKDIKLEVSELDSENCAVSFENGEIFTVSSAKINGIIDLIKG